MRKLAIDFGTKVCGFAISDELGIIASPLCDFEYANDDYSLILQKIDEIRQTYKEIIDTIVLGYPTNAYDGSKNPRSLLVEAFHEQLENHLKNQSIKIVLVDERFSTRIATQRLKDLQIKAAKRKKVKDKMAAVVILESFLNH
ncbi:Holliday junction resolvase RuvX [Ureaplasma miroungigenitalium]|uniref:Putative pre-16S rRNA nuclease n=1 Tax=Ureaplasma miroungigenitalium TaxID=1042321 RepID=A0ABT3BN94_9BACT|nr:Holliday junction resolvase RuvX [Ureaplasma miroungigenitalium]MCV3728556.1 Holliday junction resolvase RuvX [Ureaplasma miroungigenitalium]MCV3734437.1 Holliday junction resolvase RuvX [Ureaplasma miroungigenitalium]